MTPQEGIRLKFLLKLAASLAPPVELGAGPRGVRRMVPILSGSFDGPLIKGTVPRGGVDWQLTRPDGVTEIEAQYSLLTDDGALIRVINRGYRHGPPGLAKRFADGEKVDPSDYYFRAAPQLDAPVGRYDWLNRGIFISTGERLPDSVALHFYEVL